VSELIKNRLTQDLFEPRVEKPAGAATATATDNITGVRTVQSVAYSTGRQRRGRRQRRVSCRERRQRRRCDFDCDRSLDLRISDHHLGVEKRNLKASDIDFYQCHCYIANVVARKSQ
jgi:hypothetical protein